MASEAPTLESIHAELERARLTFHTLSEYASPQDLRRGTTGTRWTNRQMLFHMLLGYLVVRRVLPLVHLLDRAPPRVSATFAWTLNSASQPFHVINYLGSCGGALVFRGPLLTAAVDRTIAGLQGSLDRESEDALSRSMHFPVDWDPFFTHTMTVLEVYHYGTQHFDFHLHQLTLPASE